MTLASPRRAARGVLVPAVALLAALAVAAPASAARPAADAPRGHGHQSSAAQISTEPGVDEPVIVERSLCSMLGDLPLLCPSPKKPRR